MPLTPLIPLIPTKVGGIQNDTLAMWERRLFGEGWLSRKERGLKKDTFDDI